MLWGQRVSQRPAYIPMSSGWPLAWEHVSGVLVKLPYHGLSYCHLQQQGVVLSLTKTASAISVQQHSVTESFNKTASAICKNMLLLRHSPKQFLPSATICCHLVIHQNSSCHLQQLVQCCLITEQKQFIPSAVTHCHLIIYQNSFCHLQ